MNTSAIKKILFIFRQSPYSGNLAREALDVAFAAGIFNQQVSVLFMDDGVWQLLPDQQSSLIGVKQQYAMLTALPLYDIEHVYVDAVSLAVRLPTHAITLPYVPADADQVKTLMQTHDIILGF